MTQSLHPAAQKGFSSAAELYQQVRPNYPAEIVSWLQECLQIHENSTVIDLGSGTGKFLPYLKQTHADILAVEPIGEMLQQLQQAYTDIKTLQAFSHAIPLNDQQIDAVICAQSFHWFDNMETLTEIHRILKPQGHLGLVWNQRDERTNWVKALADFLLPLEGDTPRYHSENWKKVFENQNLFSFESLETFSQSQHGTVEQVVSKRLLSTSFIAAMTEKDQLQLKAQFEKIVYDFTGLGPQDQIDFPYVTYAYHFQKSTSSNHRE
ncbi:class I SAM-dependent methyltransferase [Acinetobacter seifertii]|uniref:class I SAM-dependent methyltransferase n=1 Tax=Acinetobacter seifertii TaxID=1530123 RepID=UPI0018DEBF8C|nr:class I SAM-dependent methyltransferase [Acinetobacter seifertii]QPV59632.1 class I SAM-dependent methyltransferase [Acinetobacter seifertii]